MRFFPSRPAQPNPVVVLGERNKIPFRDLYGGNREGVVGGKKREENPGDRKTPWGGRGSFLLDAFASAQKEEKSVTNPFTFGNFLAKKEKIRFLPSFLFPLFLLPSSPSPCAKMCTREEGRGRRRPISRKRGKKIGPKSEKAENIRSLFIYKKKSCMKCHARMTW